MVKPTSKFSRLSKLKDRLSIFSKPKGDKRASHAPIFDLPSQVQPRSQHAANHASIVPVPDYTQTASISHPVDKPAETPETVHNDTKSGQVNDAESTTATKSPPSKINPDSGMGPISNLWNEAYEGVKAREESLIQEY